MGIQLDQTFLRLQYGQPVPLLLAKTKAFHSCPFLHYHQTFLLLQGVISFGVRFLFLVGCHSLVNFGFLVCRQLSKQTALPEQ